MQHLVHSCISASAANSRARTWVWLKQRGSTQDSRTKQALSSREQAWLTEMCRVFHIAEDYPPEVMWPAPRDPLDQPLWSAARRSRTLFVVTFNLKDGPPENADGVRRHEDTLYVAPDVFVLLAHYWSELMALGEQIGPRAIDEINRLVGHDRGRFPPAVEAFLLEQSRKFANERTA